MTVDVHVCTSEVCQHMIMYRTWTLLSICNDGVVIHTHFHFSDELVHSLAPLLIVHDLSLFFVISTCSIDLVLYIGLDVTMVTE